MFQELQT